MLVSAFDKSSSPKKRIAQRLMNELMEEDRLRLSTRVLQELFVTKKVSQRCSSEEALAGAGRSGSLAPDSDRLRSDSSGSRVSGPGEVLILGCTDLLWQRRGPVRRCCTAKN